MKDTKLFIIRLLQIYRLNYNVRFIEEEDLGACIGFYENQEDENEDFLFCISKTLDNKFVAHHWVHHSGDYMNPPETDLNQYTKQHKGLINCIKDCISKWYNSGRDEALFELQMDSQNMEIPNDILLEEKQRI